MIPTSIDGTDITGATIDGTDVTEITVDGDTVFTAGIPNSLIEDWESGDFTYWRGNGQNNGHSISTTQVYKGSFSLYLDGTDPSGAIISDGGKESTPSAGDCWHFFTYHTDNGNFRVNFAVDAGESATETGLYVGSSYYLFVRSDEVRLADGGSNFGSLSHTSKQNEWLETYIDWGVNGDFDIRRYDSNSNLLDSFTTNDTSYTSGGVGIYTYTGQGYIDQIEKVVCKP